MGCKGNSKLSRDYPVDTQKVKSRQTEETLKGEGVYVYVVIWCSSYNSNKHKLYEYHSQKEGRYP